MLIEDKLRQNAEQQPHKTALICGDEAYTYGQLWQAVMAKVDAMGDVKGRLMPLVATSTADFLIAYFAVHVAGAVAVPLHKDLPKSKLDEYSARLSRGSAPEGVADILFTTGTTGNAKAVMISHQTIWANAENLVFSQGFSSDVTFIINGPLIISVVCRGLPNDLRRRNHPYHRRNEGYQSFLRCYRPYGWEDCNVSCPCCYPNARHTVG